MEIKQNPWVDFLIVILASGIARGRVRTTAATTTTVVSRNMAAMLLQRNAPSVCSSSVPSFLCGIFKEKKTNDNGGWSNVLHWSKKKINRKQELTGEEVAKESRGRALGKEVKQYCTMPRIIASQGLEQKDEIKSSNAMKQS